VVSELLPCHRRYVFCHQFLSGSRSCLLSLLRPPGWVFGSSSPCPHQTQRVWHRTPNLAVFPFCRQRKVPPQTRSHQKYLMQPAKTPTHPAYAQGDGGPASSPHRPACRPQHQARLAVAHSVYPQGIAAPHSVGFRGVPSLGENWGGVGVWFCLAFYPLFIFGCFSPMNEALTRFHSRYQYRTPEPNSPAEAPVAPSQKVAFEGG